MMSKDKYYACWSKDGVVRCSAECMDFWAAEDFLLNRRREGAVTTLETCIQVPQVFYGQAAAAMRAADRLAQLSKMKKSVD